MLRTTFLIFSGMSLLITTGLNAQHFPRNPSLQQIVGYQLKQVQNWQMEQLPANSVLYQFQFKTPVSKIESNKISDSEPFIRFPAQYHVNEAGFQEIDGFRAELSKNHLYTDWLKQSRWLVIKKNIHN